MELRDGALTQGWSYFEGYFLMLYAEKSSDSIGEKEFARAYGGRRSGEIWDSVPAAPDLIGGLSQGQALNSLDWSAENAKVEPFAGA